MSRVLKILPVLALLFAACGSDDSGASGSVEITGDLTYPQRIALLPDGTATVTLEDVSLADAPSVIIVEETIELGDQQVPVPFELAVDPDDLESDRSYSVRATITGPDDSLRWTTDTAYPYDPGSGSVDVGDLVLVPVADSDADPGASPLTGAWNVTEIDGTPALDQTMPSLEFGVDGVLSGDASCNRFTTGYTIEGDALLLDAIALTAMACIDEVAEQEFAFIAILDDAPTFELVDANQLLMIESASGSTMSARR